MTTHYFASAFLGAALASTSFLWISCAGTSSPTPGDQPAQGVQGTMGETSSDSTQNSASGPAIDSPVDAGADSAVDAAMAKVQTAKVIFKKDKVYELAFFSIAEGKQGQLFKEYLPQAKPYLVKYGAKPVGMFHVKKSLSKNIDSQMVAIFEWPDMEAKLALEKDAGFQEVAKLREGVFSFFKAGWFAAPEDKQVTFRSDKIYEFGGATLYPTVAARAALNTYFEVSTPIKRAYGGAFPKFVLSLAPTGPKSASSYTHEMQFIVEWDSLADHTKLFADRDFNARALPLMKKAVQHADFVFGKFAFPRSM